eukprot:5989947-Ditylum_brightwellii.AAC.1
MATFHCVATSYVPLYVLAFKSGTMVDSLVTGEVDYSLWGGSAVTVGKTDDRESKNGLNKSKNEIDTR